MKLRPFIILLLGLTISCSQTTEKITESASDNTNSSDKTTKTEMVNSDSPKDTLIIVDSEFTIDPFDFGENPLKRLTSIESSSTNYQTYKNPHVDNQIDTSFQVTINVDTFEVYKTASENWVTAADINSDRFPTRQGIRIGMTKSEIKEQLKSADNFPDFIRLQNLEVLEWIDLKFVNNRLEKIEFKGYMD
ncbi:hypothetical protein IFO69_20450 [Echinicola sp. CAU 1574]|uniref:Uncharacterized protein n=1 Tax=Echinicola arenosa TaxID=2774144 RepID=A0ABR9AQV0_9BACT|nr:hypothetical protein [Echinicola arenosa]MBD8491137.1 hypothetical protein [Echinicola arenosa]